MTIKYHKYDLSQLKNLHVLFRTAKSPCFFGGGDGNCCHKHLSDSWKRRDHFLTHRSGSLDSACGAQNPSVDGKSHENCGKINVIQSYIGGIPPPTHYGHFYEGPPVNLNFPLLVGWGYPQVIHFLSCTPGSTNMAGKWARIEDVFPIVNGDIPASYVSLPEGMSKLADLGHCFHPLKWGWIAGLTK